MWTVKIKADRYGQAIALLLNKGGTFQTRFEDTLIVNRDQRRALEEAGLVAANGAREKPRKPMPRRRSKLERFQADLAALQESIP